MEAIGLGELRSAIACEAAVSHFAGVVSGDDTSFRMVEGAWFRIETRPWASSRCNTLDADPPIGRVTMHAHGTYLSMDCVEVGKADARKIARFAMECLCEKFQANEKCVLGLQRNAP